MPPAPVEALIAASIVGVELVHAADGARLLLVRHPWSMALAFGFLHGLGFAGALAAVGLPDGEIPLALRSFNVGIEAGQLLFVAAVLLAAAALRRATWRRGPGSCRRTRSGRARCSGSASGSWRCFDAPSD